MPQYQVKYGKIKGNAPSFEIGMGASEVLKAKSGRFVTNDDSGRAEVADAGETELLGFVESGDLTCSSTEGATKVKCWNSTENVYRIPLAYDGSTYTVNYSSAVLGETCDLVRVSNIQYADLGNSGEDVLIVVGGRASDNTTMNGGGGYVDVMINPVKMTYSTGVA